MSISQKLRIRSNRALVAALTGLLTLAVAEVPANRAEACGHKLDLKSSSTRMKKKRVIVAKAPRPLVINAQLRPPVIRTSSQQPPLPVGGTETPTHNGPIASALVQTMPTTPAIDVTGGSATQSAAAELREELFFGPNSSQLDYARVLMDSAKWLAAHPDVAITIEGHADPSGMPQRNLALSKSRAESVRAWLVAHGVDASRIEMKALGDTKLKYGENDGRNRRVSIGLKRP